MSKETPREFVQKYKRDVTSQHGEDGIIEELFKRIGATNTWCVEFGALNGTHHSNTWNLVMKKGWSGVLIEADPTYAEKLAQVYKDTPRAITINEFIEFDGAHSLDTIFSRTPLPKDFDLLSVDIDGNDYHVWESLTQYRPRVVIIEFNPTIPNDIVFIQPRDMSVQQGSSLRALEQLGTRIGYTLAAVVGVNAVFVVDELFPKLNLSRATLDAMNPDTSYYTRLFQLYDGTLVLDGYQMLLWQRTPIRQEAIQVLSKARRVYRSGVSSNGFVRTVKYYVRKSAWYPIIMKVRNLFK